MKDCRIIQSVFWNYAKLISACCGTACLFIKVVDTVTSLLLDNDTINSWKAGWPAR
jgi:ribonucleoside-diphosphate reductase alpha chain